MYRVKSHLWPVSRAFLKMLSLGHQFLLHVWAKIVPRARFSLPLHILHFSPSKIDGCFGYIRTSGSLVASCSSFAFIHLQKSMNVSAKITLLAGLAPSPSLGGVWPSNKCLLVSKRHVFYELFEAPLGLREKHVFYGPFESLHGLRKWCKPARGTIFADTLVAFSQRKGGRTPFLRPTKVLFSP